MAKLALAATALVGAAALTGSTVLSGSATTAAAPTVHTKTFVIHNIRDHPLGGLTNGGAEVLKSNGRIVGFDSYSGKTFTSTAEHVVWAAFALRGGMIMTRLTQQTNEFHGPILRGAGKYAGVEGTISVRQRANGSERVWVRYHF